MRISTATGALATAEDADAPGPTRLEYFRSTKEIPLPPRAARAAAPRTSSCSNGPRRRAPGEDLFPVSGQVFYRDTTILQGGEGLPS